jgi:hypothetical protein
MCTTIANKAPISGSGKGPQGWFNLAEVYITYDHPFHARLEHALNLDFVNEAAGGRVAVELTRESARELARGILAALEAADAYEGDS